MKTLDLNRMAEVKGGDYCSTLKMIGENNDLSWDAHAAAKAANEKYCPGQHIEWDAYVVW